MKDQNPHSPIIKTTVFLKAVCTAFLMAACLSQASADSANSDNVIASPTKLDRKLTPFKTQPIPVTESDEISLLSRLLTDVRFTYTFHNAPEALITETLDLSSAQLAEDDFGEYLWVEFSPGAFLYCEATEPNIYACVRFFEGKNFTLNLFELNNNRGAGIFEFCVKQTELAPCIDDFTDNTDGETHIALGESNSLDNDNRITIDNGAYLSYYKQGDTADLGKAPMAVDKEILLKAARRQIEMKHR